VPPGGASSATTGDVSGRADGAGTTCAGDSACAGGVGNPCVGGRGADAGATTCDGVSGHADEEGTTSIAGGAGADEGGTTPPLAPSQRYARLGRTACEAELAQRGIAFTRVDSARGVLEPLRLGGPLHGITYHSWEPAAQRPTSTLEIIDCRLVLALDDFSAQLAAHDVVEVVHFSMYRPPPLRWAAGKIASRHPGGLAIDIASFVKRDGTKLVVEHDFHGRIGASTCGPGTGPHPATPQAIELRRVLCDAADAKLFNVLLTPDFNWPHRNHFHLEVTADAKWFYVH
jgi:hypothetical protein